MKTVSTLRVVGDDDATVLPTLSADPQLAFADVAELDREGLLAMSVAVGLRVMSEMMDAEVTDQVGLKHARLPDRTAVRHTAAAGSVVLGARRVPVSRPGLAPSTAPRSSWPPTPRSATTICSTRS